MGGGLLFLGEGGPCRIWRSGGFPKFSRKIFPLKPFLPPFHPFFFPSTLSFNSSFTQTPPSNSLEQALISLFYLATPFFSSKPLPTSSRPLPDLFQTSPESLHRVSQRPPKRPFLGLFRGTPKTPKKGLKTPFLTPFLTPPYPL